MKHLPTLNHTAKLCFKAFLDLIYPRYCPVCGHKLPASISGICILCMLKLEEYIEPMEKGLERLVGSPFVNNLYALYTFKKENDVQRMVHSLKYGHNLEWGYDVGRMLGRIILERSITYDAIIPVPIAPERYNQRGYNQSFVIAQGIASILNTPIYDKAFRRKRFSHSQTFKSREQRVSNVKNAFLPGKACGMLQDKKLLLVDDVLTTGATMLSLCDSIEIYGPQSMDIAVVAVTSNLYY
ncbi:ComF family protein [Porphyromonas pogonae]|uniref:ComF family protein n=2 Tax=Porphyromonas pogonae TaxID=867595 RepID=UPI00300EEB4D